MGEIYSRICYIGSGVPRGDVVITVMPFFANVQKSTQLTFSLRKSEPLSQTLSFKNPFGTIGQLVRLARSHQS